MLRPGEAAEAIGIKPSTLRVYVQRFADLLGEDATGAEGHRFYSERDVETLRRARELIGRGLTYERAFAELRGGPVARSRRSEPIEQSPVTIGLQALEQAVDAWRQLAEERANEISALRSEIQRLQEMLLGGSRLTPLPRAADRA
jgi:DNA-binding transcriptional MerR regulator